MPSAYAPPSMQCASSRTRSKFWRSTPGITIRETPSFNADAATSSRSASNSDASRWQWVSIHMKPPRQLDRYDRLLEQHAVAQAHDTVAARGEIGIMRDDHEARFQRLRQLQHQVEHRVRRGPIEVPGRLIGEHACRPRAQRARNRHALTLAARQFARPMFSP